MKAEERRLQELLAGQPEVLVRESKIEETVRRAGEAFYEEESRELLSGAEFLYWQSGYIHKRWWVLQGLLLALLWWILKYSDSNMYMQRCMGIAAPLFAVLFLPELWKNRNANSWEVECTAYYSLRWIYGARLLLFAWVDMALLSAFFLAASLTVRMSIESFMIQFLLPFNVTCCICFGTFYSRRGASQTLALFLCMVWTWLWGRIVLENRVYSIIAGPVWVVMFGASLLYIIYSVARGFIKFEGKWEDGAGWN